MLTLRKPIQLKSARGLSLRSSRELGTLAGNYDMAQSAISPSSLLLLFSPQPEFPEDLGGSTSIRIRQSSTDVRNLTLSVVNNLLNTIAVNQQNDFTYQDRIHITSMLHRLGINNVQQFMQQVQLLRQEHQSVSELLELYRNETVQQFASSKTASETHNRYDSRHSTTQQVVVGGSPYYLHNEIYHRLQTGDIYQELHAHQTIPSMPDTFVSNLQLRLSEQLRVSNHLHLNELRSRAVSANQMTLHHHQNSYETGELLPPPTTEQEVLQQASTAMLLSTVDNLLTQRFNTTHTTTNNWVNVAEQLEQTAYNTLSRFESYHSGQHFEYNKGTQYTQSRLEVYNTEATLLRQLIREEQQHPVMGEPTAWQSLTDVADTRLTHLIPDGGEDYTTTDGERITELQTTTEQVTNQITDITRQLLQSVSPLSPTAPVRRTPMEPLRELLQKTEPSPQADEQLPLSQQAQSQLTALIHDTTTYITHPAAEQIFSQLTNVLQQPLPTSVSATDIQPAELLLSQVPDAPPQEVSEQVLIQQLDEIDRRNREMLTRLQERTEVLRHEVAPVQPVDPVKMRADALRAITEPDKLFAELRERPQAPMQHSQSPMVEAMLELATPEVRTLMETVYRYANNPEAQLAGLHTATPLELHQDAQQVLQASRTVEQVERELLQTTRQVEQQTVLQSLQEWTQPVQGQPHTSRPHAIQPVPIVHKSERKVLDEEFMELLEQQKTTRTEVEYEQQEQLQVNTVRELNQTNLNQQIVTQSTEEITELINRALTRQMGTISDKVYNQMERRLQMERSRRGRF